MMHPMRLAGSILAFSLAFAAPVWGAANGPGPSSTDIRASDTVMPEGTQPSDASKTPSDASKVPSDTPRDPGATKTPDERADDKPKDDPAQTKDEPNRQTADDTPKPSDPERSAPGSVGGLPDAVTVLDILRRLPPWPPQRTSDEDTDAPPLRGTPQQSAPVKSQRVVNVPPNVPFKPARPAPRPRGTPPAILGAASPETLPREVLVTLQTGSSDADVFALAQDFGLDGQTLYQSPLLGTRIVRFRIPDTRTVAQVVQQLGGDARVAIAAPHYVYTATQGAAKPLPIPQYAPAKLKLDEAHKLARGKRVKIAVIDTAMDTAHPVFFGARIETFDALGGGGKAEAHGTAIAGIAAARSELSGVAPAADVVSVRAFTSEAGASAKSFTFAILKGLDWAVMSGARVINMSFAGPEDPILAKAIAAAEERGLILVAAAGNGGPKAKPAYPAAYSQVLAVTATDDRDGLYKDANRGRYIAIAAPGVDIIAAAPGGAYDVSSGTSLAAAHVSGIAALMLERNPALTSADVRAALTASAQKLKGKAGQDAGAGVADAAAALAAVKK